MKVHANAPLGPKGRGVMVRRVVVEGWSLMEAAAAAGMSERRCREWVRRYRAEGVEDAETLELVREMGATFAQGFHLGQPAPVQTV